MERVDEQIISLLYGEWEEQEARGKQEDKMPPPLFTSRQTILKINGETIPFTEELLLNGKLRVPLPKTFHVKHWKPIAWGRMDSLDFGKEGRNDEPVGARLSSTANFPL
ncbi:hypothetical protein [Paenibacillus popilliae]|uniref:Uncharacterized protein n=1 Tax=Paenibacillus popilliae ATCC 14706 TaxID=1212764 RepID=M9LYH6_PAEPP|nr:hypothetical protein [Paenibacillus popilliae]GAC41164.1 hypothetical protein PPOP_0505 [Paenibacillus popilliae ATCC 14706]